MRPDDAPRRVRLDGHALGIERQPVALDDVTEPINVAAGQQRAGQGGDDLVGRDGPRVGEALGQSSPESAHLSSTRVPFVGAHGHPHELVGTAEVLPGLLDLHEVHKLPAARLHHQRKRWFLHHGGVHLPDAKRVEEIRADGGETNTVGVGAGLVEKEQQERVVGVPKARYADRPPLQVGNFQDRASLVGRDREREQGKATRRGEAADIGPVGDRLQRYVEGGARVVDRAAYQRLHGGVAPARIDQLDVEALVGEVPARSCYLVRELHTATGRRRRAAH